MLDLARLILQKSCLLSLFVKHAIKDLVLLNLAVIFQDFCRVVQEVELLAHSRPLSVVRRIDTLHRLFAQCFVSKGAQARISLHRRVDVGPTPLRHIFRLCHLAQFDPRPPLAVGLPFLIERLLEVLMLREVLDVVLVMALVIFPLFLSLVWAETACRYRQGKRAARGYSERPGLEQVLTACHCEHLHHLFLPPFYNN